MREKSVWVESRASFWVSPSKWADQCVLFASPGQLCLAQKMSYKKDYSQTSDRHGFFDYDFHHQHGEHGGYSGGGGGEELCCPLVADPLTVFTLLSFIAFATAFLNVLVTMNIMMRRRRRRSDRGAGLKDLLHSGTVEKEGSGQSQHTSCCIEANRLPLLIKTEQCVGTLMQLQRKIRLETENLIITL